MSDRQGRARRALLFVPGVFLAVLLVAFSVTGEVVQTPSAVIPKTLVIIQASSVLDDEQKDALTTRFFEAAVGSFISDDEGVSLLEASGYPLLIEGDDPALVLAAMDMALEAITTGAIDPPGAIIAIVVWIANEGGLEDLVGLLDEQASPPGILNAIGRALSRSGYVQTGSSILGTQVELLVEAEAPPGIALRVVKQTIRDNGEPDMSELLTQLQLLGDLLAEGEPPGLAANAVTGRGSGNPHEEEEASETMTVAAASARRNGRSANGSSSGKQNGQNGNGKKH